MGKSKKKFIDKKNASTYHLLHRSQRDVAAAGEDEDENAQGGKGDMILWPSPDNNKTLDAKVLGNSDVSKASASMNQISATLTQAGLVDDYDYEQHLKPITGSGAYFSAQGGRNAIAAATADPRARVFQEDHVQEVSRQLDSIALTPDCMDDDVAQALFGDFDEANFEEILDDFCIAAAQEPNEIDGDGEEEEFDYDAHIRSLMERAAKRDHVQGGLEVHEHTWGKHDQDFFSNARPLEQHEIDDEDYNYVEDVLMETAGVVPALNAEAERALCEKFEQALAEYDSDEIGDLDEECEDIRGDRSLEGDAQVKAALEEYLEEKKDDIFMEGTHHLSKYRRTGGSGFAALVGKNLVPVKQLDGLDLNFEQPLGVKEILQDANQILANPEMEPPAEEILIDGKSYFSERTRNPWDCESILSTYSNLDNNPVTIESNRRRRKMKSSKHQVSPETLPEEEPVQIRLSSKTGLPLGVLASRYDDRLDNDDGTSMVSVNKGKARSNKETPEEKKVRKLAVKKERELARMQKKVTRETFRDEFMKRSADIMADDVGGKSVFRY